MSVYIDPPPPPPEYTQTNNSNPLDKIVELYERLLKEEKERVKTLEKRIKELEGKA